MALIDKASLLMVPSVYEDGTLYNVLPSGNKAPDETGNANGYDQTRADFSFTRGANLAATRVNASGLIEKGRENLLLQSNNFGTTWINTSSSETSGQSGYDGSSNAWLLTKSASGGSIQQTGLSVSGVQTFSLYVKKGNSDWVSMTILGGSNPRASFDLENGSLGTTLGGAIDAKITSVGSGWYRCEVIANVSSTGVYIYPSEGNHDTSGTSGSIYIQDAQLENGLVATDYIETGATTATAGVLENTPRIDYSSGAGALLLEPQRTNVLPQSEYYESSVWTKDSSSVNGNAATSPEGLNNASLLYPTSATTAKWGAGMYDFNSTANDTYTNSVYVKSNGWRWVYMIDPSGLKNAWFDLENGVTGTTESPATSSIESLGNDWYRCSVSSNILHSYTYCGVYFSDADNSYICTSNGTNGTYVYGFQSEAGSYVSSYVPTYGSAATRGADSCSVTGVSDILNDSEGTLFVEMSALANDQTSRRLSISDGTNNNRVMIGYSTGSNAVQFVLSDGGAVVVNSAHTLSDIKETAKIAFKYQLNNCEMYINGSRVILDTTATMPSGLSVLGFYQGTTNENLYANMKQLAYFPEALSDSELATLTTL